MSKRPVDLLLDDICEAIAGGHITNSRLGIQGMVVEMEGDLCLQLDAG